MDRSITVLLSDGRLIEARLPANPALAGSALIAKYSFGDQVTIDCQSISPVWDPASNVTQTHEVATVRFLRRPEPKELVRAIQSPDWRRGGNLLHPPTDATTEAAGAPPAQVPSHPDPAFAEHRALLEKARTVNLDRAAHLPNFVADETVNCYSQPYDPNADQLTGPPAWQQTATVQSEVTFKGAAEARRRVGPDGKGISGQGVPSGCIEWSSGYILYVKPIFDPKCGTTITFSKTMGEPGKQSWVYNFSAPPESLCFGPGISGSVRAYSTHEGSVLIDIPSGILIALVARSRGYPKAFDIVGTDETASWGMVKIGEESHLLPVSYDRVKSLRNRGASRVLATYTNHRHFEADSTITFQ